MVPFHEFLALDEDDRDGKFPYIWTVDTRNRLSRVLCTREIVKSAEERRQFWRQMKSIAGLDRQVDVNAIVQQTKAEMAQKLSSTLISLAASGDMSILAGGAVTANGNGAAPAAANGGSGAAAPADYEPVWIDTAECTACDECTNLNPNLFGYNEQKQAVVLNPKGGAFKDIVKAAEKCTAGCIHPGTPFNPDESGVDKLLQRAAKFR